MLSNEVNHSQLQEPTYYINLINNGWNEQ